MTKYTTPGGIYDTTLGGIMIRPEREERMVMEGHHHKIKEDTAADGGDIGEIEWVEVKKLCRENPLKQPTLVFDEKRPELQAKMDNVEDRTLDEIGIINEID